MIATSRKNGFTLIELSIVLVIVGILIGGILVARSMIESAENNKFITQLQQYSVAIDMFKSSYKELPGDSRIYNSTGNNDGVIEYCSSCSSTFVAEGINVWHDLSAAGMLATQYNEAADWDDINPGVTVPEFKFGSATGIFRVGQVMGTSTVWDGTTVDFYSNSKIGAGYQINDMFIQFGRICNLDVWPYNRLMCQIMTPLRAKAIDMKMDDGMPNTGELAALVPYPDPDPGWPETSGGMWATCIGEGYSASSYAASTDYLIDTTKDACALAMKINYRAF